MSRNLTHSRSNDSLHLPSVLDTSTIVTSQLASKTSVLSNLSSTNKHRLMQLSHEAVNLHGMHGLDGDIRDTMYGRTKPRTNGWLAKPTQTLKSNVPRTSRIQVKVERKDSDGGNEQISQKIDHLLSQPHPTYSTSPPPVPQPYNTSISGVKTWGGSSNSGNTVQAGGSGQPNSVSGKTSTYYTHIQKLTQQVRRHVDSLAIDVDTSSKSRHSSELQHISESEQANRHAVLTHIHHLIESLNASKQSQVYSELLQRDAEINQSEVLDPSKLTAIEYTSNLLNDQADQRAEYVLGTLATSEVNTLKALNSYYQLIHSLASKPSKAQNINRLTGQTHRSSITSQLLAIDSLEQAEDKQKQSELKQLAMQVEELSAKVKEQALLLKTYGLVDDVGEPIETNFTATSAEHTDDADMEATAVDGGAEPAPGETLTQRQTILALQSRLAHELEHKHHLSNDIAVLNARLQQYHDRRLDVNADQSQLRVCVHIGVQTDDSSVDLVQAEASHVRRTELEEHVKAAEQRNKQLVMQVKKLHDKAEQAEKLRVEAVAAHKAEVQLLQQAEQQRALAAHADDVSAEDVPVQTSANNASQSQQHGDVRNTPVAPPNIGGKVTAETTATVSHFAGSNAHHLSAARQPNTRQTMQIGSTVGKPTHSTVQLPEQQLQERHASRSATSAPSSKPRAVQPQQHEADDMTDELPEVSVKSASSTVQRLTGSVRQLKQDKTKLQAELVKTRQVHQQLANIEEHNAALVNTVNQLNSTIVELQRRLQTRTQPAHRYSNDGGVADVTNDANTDAPSTIAAVRLQPRTPGSRVATGRRTPHVNTRDGVVSERTGSSRPHTHGVAQLKSSHHFAADLPAAAGTSASDVLTLDDRGHSYSSRQGTAAQRTVDSHSNAVNSRPHTGVGMDINAVGDAAMHKRESWGTSHDPSAEPSKRTSATEIDDAAQYSVLVSKRGAAELQHAVVGRDQTFPHVAPTTQQQLLHAPAEYGALMHPPTQPTQRASHHYFVGPPVGVAAIQQRAGLNDLLQQAGLMLPDHVLDELAQVQQTQLNEQARLMRAQNDELSREVIELKMQLTQLKQGNKRIQAVAGATIQPVTQSAQVTSDNTDAVPTDNSGTTDMYVDDFEDSDTPLQGNAATQQRLRRITVNNSIPLANITNTGRQVYIANNKFASDKQTTDQKQTQLHAASFAGVDLPASDLPTQRYHTDEVTGQSMPYSDDSSRPPLHTKQAGLNQVDVLRPVADGAHLYDTLSSIDSTGALTSQSADVQHTVLIDTHHKPQSVKPLPYQTHNALPVSIPELHEQQRAAAVEFHKQVNALQLHDQIDLLNATLSRLFAQQQQQYGAGGGVGSGGDQRAMAEELMRMVNIPEHLKHLLVVEPMELLAQQAVIGGDDSVADEMALLRGVWKPEKSVVTNE